MILDIQSGQILEQNDTRKLVIAGHNDSHPMFHPDAYMYYDGIEVTIMFYDGYIRVFAQSHEIVTGFEKLWFIQALKNCGTGNSVRIASHISRDQVTAARTVYNRDGAVRMAGDFALEADSDFVTKYKEYDRGKLESIKDIVIQLAYMNNIMLPLGNERRLPFETLLTLYCFPMLRDVYRRKMSLNNMMSIGRWASAEISYEPVGIPDSEIGISESQFSINIVDELKTLDFLRQRNLKDALRCALNGKFSKKIFKDIVEKKLLVQTRSIKTHMDGDINESFILRHNKYLEKRGFSKPNKDGVSSKTEFNFELFLYIKMFSNIFTIDHVQTILEELPKQNRKIPPPPTKEMIAANFELFKDYPKERLMKLFLTEYENIQITDAERQYKEYKNKKMPKQLLSKYPDGIPLPKKPKSWKEVHDRISKCYNEIKEAEKDQEIEYSPEVFQLHFAEMDGIRLKLPSSGIDIVKWGKEMKHCIASYVDDHVNGNCCVVAVYQDDVFKWNAEFKKQKLNKDFLFPEDDPNQLFQWNLYQCRGLSNKSAPDEVKEIVEALGKPILERVQYEDHQKKNAL